MNPTQQNHNTSSTGTIWETIWGAICGTGLSLYQHVGEYVDFKSIISTICCTITGIVVARIIKKYFPESKSK